MAGQPGFFDIEDRLKQLSVKGDALERLNAVVDFELFRTDLERAVPRADRAKGGRPSFDHVLMFKTLVLQTSHNLSDERTEYPACAGASLYGAIVVKPRLLVRRRCVEHSATGRSEGSSP